MYNIKRPRVNGELKSRVAETVVEYLKRNAGHQIPNTRIATRFGVSPSQVQTVTKQLIADGIVTRLSRATYCLAQQTAKQPELQPVYIGELQFTDKVAQLAQKFYWETGDDSLKSFVKSLEDGGVA